MINVTKSFLPPLEEYTEYLKGIWERGHLTNHGPLVNELEEKIKDYLGVKHFFFINNGTVALQIAIKALGVKGEVITTPFSYVATTSSVMWEECTPVFADIDPQNFTLDPSKIEAAITANTTAILATHVYGIPCHVEAIKAIAEKHGLKVIYDAAHAFGVKFGETSVLNYGDIATLSFHATKLFHTVEGGGMVTNDDTIAHKIAYMRNFGHKGQEEFWGMGINGKNSEFHAAMGLCVFPHMSAIISRRKELSELYDQLLAGLGSSLRQLLTVKDNLNAAYIYPRRYFYPSLNMLPYIPKTEMPVSEDISRRVLCLPLYHDLAEESVKRICSIISEVLRF